MKKIFVLLIACCTLFSCFDTEDKRSTNTYEYHSDYDATDYLYDYMDELDAEDNTIYQYNDSISVWYFEPISIGNQKNGIIHSSFDCHTVNNGVIQNAYSPLKLNHSFCTKCMTKEGIAEWGKWYDDAKVKQKAKKRNPDED